MFMNVCGINGADVSLLKVSGLIPGGRMQLLTRPQLMSLRGTASYRFYSPLRLIPSDAILLFLPKSVSSSWSVAKLPPRCTLPSQPLPENSQCGVEGELALVCPAVSQQQGARLRPVARRHQLGCSLLHVPAPLLLVGQHVGAEQGVQGGGDAAHQEPGVQEQGQELGVAGGSRLLEG